MAYIKLNRKNFFYNLEEIKKKTKDISKIAVVIKDNAYGHGLIEIAKLSNEFGIKNAIVKNRDEADKIKNLFETILILKAKKIERNSYFYTANSLNEILNAKKEANIELKIDTGMHRNGISLDELDIALDEVKKRGLNLKGVFTHFKSADELSSEFFWQKKRFEKVKKEVLKRGFTPRFHSHNSASILRVNSFNEDLVRVGIAIYGIAHIDPILTNINLKPVMSLYAKKVASRTLKKGQRVGYGGDFKTSKEIKISTYDLGYGDGWFRGDSKNPYKTLDGVILGRVSMDFISLMGEKEEVTIFNNAKEVSKHFNTISYEITTKLSPTIFRYIV